MKKCAVIIPVLNPAEDLIHYVAALLSNGVPQIIVVNDGSNKELIPIFEKLDAMERCTVLTHAVNRGKGRALKTAFAYFLEHFKDLVGVITADADGQHTVKDVCRIADALEGNDEGIILGVRDFDEVDIPKRSLIGNKLTSFIFRLLYGYNIKDTQTGLRGIPTNVLPSIIKLQGERYEYEMNMLIQAKKMNLTISEVPIETVYFNNNEGSHYNSIVDSTRIFIRLISGFLQYFFSTVTSGIIDIFFFVLLNNFLLKELSLEMRVFYATFVARAISSSYNFYINRRIVFKGSNTFFKSVLNYYILCLAIIITSYLLITFTNKFLGINVVLAKICFDILIGICSYQIQLHWVFKKRKRMY
ncbi:bifunctional glycosyltransferase family 2/GtrA family protein [Bacillus sp. APMAM]|uniref:glycosyltransferase n=1 Tax=Margalitia sp. FSL K6-0131 TaxID=2954604 RepID=UPI000F86FB5F|nr:bifunctional glycosyltransferase family 2/GtrA family protein [Bacillus sp. APMAM]RTZ55420.1 glycosyltransferase [Bacillus sp. SAJ1]